MRARTQRRARERCGAARSRDGCARSGRAPAHARMRAERGQARGRARWPRSVPEDGLKAVAPTVSRCVIRPRQRSASAGWLTLRRRPASPSRATPRRGPVGWHSGGLGRRMDAAATTAAAAPGGQAPTTGRAPAPGDWRRAGTRQRATVHAGPPLTTPNTCRSTIHVAAAAQPLRPCHPQVPRSATQALATALAQTDVHQR